MPCQSSLLWILGCRNSTGRLDSMSYRKWRETEQQPSRAGSGHQISSISCATSCQFALYYKFLWNDAHPKLCLIFPLNRLLSNSVGYIYRWEFVRPFVVATTAASGGRIILRRRWLQTRVTLTRWRNGMAAGEGGEQDARPDK